MDRIIDDKMLENLIVSQKHQIGRSVWSALTDLLSAGGFLLTATTADFSEAPSFVKPLIVALGILFLALGIYRLVNSVGKNHYDHEMLLDAIRDLDKSGNEYSLVAIANTYEEFPSKWLLRCDRTWGDTFLFLSYATKNHNIEDDKKNIINTLARELRIQTSDISVNLLKEEKSHKKYSLERKKDKVYDHRYYQATIAEFPADLKPDTFLINGVSYRWMSFEEMYADEKIRKYNSDVVGVFKDEVRL